MQTLTPDHASARSFHVMQGQALDNWAVRNQKKAEIKSSH